ncbi:MAG: hypothetical protein JWO63_581 [Frankiales bacterium]|nr:hypothetical protein [Frankiales bacterium]
MTRDFVEIAAAFARALRQAGVGSDPARLQSFLLAVEELDVLDPRDVYWAGRLTLCSSPEDLDTYDAVFALYFSGDRISTRPRPSVATRAGIARLDGGNSADREDSTEELEPEDVAAVAQRANRLEVLRHKDVAVLTPSERAELSRLFALLSPRVARRRSRRDRNAPSGRVDVRRSVRRMLANAGEPGELARSRRRTRPRRMVLLIDVSGSMAPYADALLRFGHAATRVSPATTEVFTLGTRLTRITRQLRFRDPELALRAAGAVVPDWSGGTRLGDTLKAFTDRWGQRGIARGAVVVLCSDGWERGDPRLLGTQVARLARLSHSLVWVNPHTGKAGFEPITGGMAVSLPHLDALVAGHSFAALEELAGVISNA